MKSPNVRIITDITGQVARLILFEACMSSSVSHAFLVGGKNAEPHGVRQSAESSPKGATGEEQQRL